MSITEEVEFIRSKITITILNQEKIKQFTDLPRIKLYDKLFGPEKKPILNIWFAIVDQNGNWVETKNKDYDNYPGKCNIQCTTDYAKNIYITIYDITNGDHLYPLMDNSENPFTCESFTINFGTEECPDGFLEINRFDKYNRTFDNELQTFHIEQTIRETNGKTTIIRI